MYKNYNIFINIILLILIILIVNYFLKNNKKLEKYTSETEQDFINAQNLIISSIDSLINDMNTIKNEHNINQSNLQNIITKTQDVINQINNKITQLETLIGNDEEISQLQTTINTLTQNISNLEQMILNLNNNKNNNLQTQQELQNEINYLINLNNFLDEHPRYNGEIIESFSNTIPEPVPVNINGSTITDSDNFYINTNNVKIKIGDNKYLKKLSNPEFVLNGTSTTDSDTVIPNIPEISWLNIMGYHKVNEITTGTTLENPNSESICAFAVWPNWNSTWNNINETYLPTKIELQNSDETVLFSKTIIPIQKLLGRDDGKDITEDLKEKADPYQLIFNDINYLDYLPPDIQEKIKSLNNYNGFIVNYWNQIYHSNATDEDRCQVYFLPPTLISTSREFKIVHNGRDGSISRCAILKNNNNNDNCNSVSIKFGRQCPFFKPNGALNVNGETQTYTGLTNPRTYNFTLTERLYHFGGSFTNDASKKFWGGIVCHNDVIIHSMDLPGYNLFSDTVTSRRQNLINQTRKHWRLSPNRHSIETPVFAWGRTTYYYKILN